MNLFISLLLYVFIELNLITSSLDIKENSYKIKFLLNKYKNTYRHRRRANFELGQFFERTLNIFNRTQRFGDFLHSVDLSECASGFDGRNTTQYIESHILNGLLLHHDVPASHWHEYKQVNFLQSVYNKNYASTHHEMAALARWQKNLRLVAEHNKLYLAGKHSYSLHLNHLGDLHTFDYFKKLLKLKITIPLLDPARDHFRVAYHANRHRDAPEHVDWRSRGFKPRLEEQLQCGACYAFTVTHAIQAQLFKKHGDWNELSPQQIVDCSYKDGNMGCEGGSLPAALRYVAREGLAMETSYPYTGQKGNCHYIPWLARARPNRWAVLPAGDERAMEKAVAHIGPLAVAVNAAPFTFQLYRNGIYDDLFCTPWTLNHAMLLVGYTPEYWILLNWWGRSWGEDGYIRIRRGMNRCGVANTPIYVEL